MSSRLTRNVTLSVAVAVAVLSGLFVCLCCCGIGVAGSIYWAEGRSGDVGDEVPPPAPSAFIALDAPRARQADALLRRLAETPTHDTDYWLLYGQLRSKDGEPAPRGPVQGPTEYDEGVVHTFWMGDEEQHRYWQIDAELQVKTGHAYFYVDTTTSFDEEQLRKAADLFESQIYPTNRRVFGSEWTPGIDNDPHVVVLVTSQMPFGIAGYFSSSDEYPKEINPRSNEREMIYVTSSYLRNMELFGQLLSHEFQHMIHWNQDRSESLWVNEGLSLMAEEINGYPSVLGKRQFWSNPDMQLTNWSPDPADRSRNYAASKLFLSYLSEKYGGYGILGKLAADDAYGIDGVNDLLRALGTNVGFEDVFADWVVANLVNDKGVGGGRYAYALRGRDRPRFCARLDTRDRSYAGWVRQFGADYIEIEGGGGREVTFHGSGYVRLTEEEPRSGLYAWWSNRRNMLSSSITREVDLRGVDKATLHFWTWYDMEEHFDYGYVAVSTDGGRTWETLPGTHTTSQDPNDVNYGYGYTGQSAGWLEEVVDLPYAGRRILLRFWHISDPGLNRSGWLIDDISIPEIGFSDGAEEDGNWQVDGFIRSSNYVPQSYIVQLVEYGPQTTVRRLELDESNMTTFRLGDDTRRAVLIVSGATRWTSELAPYRVEVR